MDIYSPASTHIWGLNNEITHTTLNEEKWSQIDKDAFKQIHIRRTWLWSCWSSNDEYLSIYQNMTATLSAIFSIVVYSTIRLKTEASLISHNVIFIF